MAPFSGCWRIIHCLIKRPSSVGGVSLDAATMHWCAGWNGWMGKRRLFSQVPRSRRIGQFRERPKGTDRSRINCSIFVIAWVKFHGPFCFAIFSFYAMGKEDGTFIFYFLKTCIIIIKQFCMYIVSFCNRISGHECFPPPLPPPPHMYIAHLCFLL